MEGIRKPVVLRGCRGGLTGPLQYKAGQQDSCSTRTRSMPHNLLGAHSFLSVTFEKAQATQTTATSDKGLQASTAQNESPESKQQGSVYSSKLPCSVGQSCARELQAVSGQKGPKQGGVVHPTSSSNWTHWSFHIRGRQM